MLPFETETALASTLLEVLEPFVDQPVIKRMRMRLRDMGSNKKDEVAQFRQLQKACRQDAALTAAFEAAGLPRPQDLQVVPATPDAGRMIQAFNRVVETQWEGR